MYHHGIVEPEYQFKALRQLDAVIGDKRPSQAPTSSTALNGSRPAIPAKMRLASRASASGWSGFLEKNPSMGDGFSPFSPA
ncbi:MAG: hypothetical protein IPK39_21565 [Sulfuritalea sp.]|nr:hypothetical protein [Sulfuritalea sp.]